MLGFQGLHESLLDKKAYVPAVYAAGTYNNGATGTVTNGVDTRASEEALIELNVGVVAAAHTLDVSIWQNDTNTTTGATAVTDKDGTAMAFAQIVNGGNASATLVGRIQTKNTKRYLFVKAVVVGASGIAMSANVILGKNDVEPISQDITVAFKHL